MQSCCNFFKNLFLDILSFFSLLDFNTIRYFRGTSASNGIDSTKVHVTFGESKRVINFPKEEDLKVKGLRHHFLRSFSDVLSEDVALANVKFQRYDDTFQD